MSEEGTNIQIHLDAKRKQTVDALSEHFANDVLKMDEFDAPDHPPTLEELEAGFIRDVLARNRWNRTEAARELGIHKTTLHRKIRRLAIDLPPEDGRTTRTRRSGLDGEQDGPDRA